MDIAENNVDLEQNEDAEDHQCKLGDKIHQGEHQVQGARLLDADDVDHDEDGDHHDGRSDVPGLIHLQLLEERHVFAEHTQVADGEVRRDRHRRHVVEELNPPDQEPDRVVEGSTREARASTRMRDGGRALGVIERGGDEDAPGQQQRQRREAKRKGRGDTKRVIDAGADVAVGRREQRRCPKRAGHLRGPPDHHSQVAWAASPASDGVGAHRSRA